MAQFEQKTYTCRCKKRNPLPNEGQQFVCGCGRTAHIKQGQVSIQDKQRNRK